MPFYEVVYETGNRSVMSADSDEEAIQALQNHHERALKGEPGRGTSTARMDLGEDAPQVFDYPAERIARVFVYEKHPVEYNEEMTMSADVLKKEVSEALKGKTVINVMGVAAQVRDLANPVYFEEEIGRHDSQFKMKEDKELDLPFLK